MTMETTRRDVLKTIGVGTLAISAPAILTSKSRADVMGAGEHTYEPDESWPKLPETMSIGYTHGIAQDRVGNYYVFNQSKDAMLVFDPEGDFITSWGEEFQKGAHGLKYSQEGDDEFLYLTDYELHQVVKTTLDGEVVYRLGMPAESMLYTDVSEYRPTNVAVAPNGHVYVVDGYGKSWIHRFDANLKYVDSFGGRGSLRGQTNCPHSLIVDQRVGSPKLLVADRANVRLQYFSLEGEPMAIANEDLLHPCDFDTRDGDLLIPDLFGRVTIFNGENELITHLGENPDVQTTEGYPNLPHEQRVPGKFISPHGAIWDHAGNIVVVEWVNDGRITMLRRVY